MRSEPDRQELVWLNVAKAVCILLVVMMHLGEQLALMPWAHQGMLRDGWHDINGFIRPLRMPLFFLVSGLLASDSILRPRRDTQHKRLTRPLYLYVLWGTLGQAICPIDPTLPWFTLSADNRFLHVPLLVTMSWYLVTLAMYYLLTRITLDLPVVLTLAICAVLSILGTVFEPDMAGHQPKMLRCAIFFVAGVRMKDTILAFADRASLRRALVLGFAYVVAALVGVWADTFLLPVDIVAVAAGIVLSVLAARRLSGLVSPASWLAKRTLPIYLLHVFMMPLLAYFLAALAAPVLDSFWAGAIYPVIAVPVVVAPSLALHALIRRTPAGAWLFDLPLQHRTWSRPIPARAGDSQVALPPEPGRDRRAAA